MKIAPELEVCRTFNRPFDDLFQTDISQPVTLHRRSRRLNHFDGHNHSFLQPAVKKLNQEQFEKMIAFWAVDSVDGTNNRVERNNRSFRMRRKTQGKRSKQHRIQQKAVAQSLCQDVKAPTL